MESEALVDRDVRAAKRRVAERKPVGRMVALLSEYSVSLLPMKF